MNFSNRFFNRKFKPLLLFKSLRPVKRYANNLQLSLNHFSHFTLPVQQTRIDLENDYFLSFSYFSMSTSLNEKPNICWKCSSQNNEYEVLCDKCNIIQKMPKNVNYFKLFKMSEKFDINVQALITAYKKMQMVTHPDKYSMKSPEEIAIAENSSSLINKAYNTLRVPWTRGVYILKCNNIDFSETTMDNPELLVQIMERNEVLESVVDVPSLLAVKKENDFDISNALKLVSKAFGENDLASAKAELIKLKYFTNVETKIAEKKLFFGIVD